MASLNWADWTLIIIIMLSSLMSLKRGFIKEALSLATWVVAFIVARTFHTHFQTLLLDAVDEPTLLDNEHALSQRCQPSVAYDAF